MPVDIKTRLAALVPDQDLVEKLTDLCRAKKLNHPDAIEICKLIKSFKSASPQEIEPMSLRTAEDALSALEMTLARAYHDREYNAVVQVTRAAADMHDWARGGAKNLLDRSRYQMEPEQAMRALKLAAAEIGCRVVPMEKRAQS